MSSNKRKTKSPLEATNAIYEALEGLDNQMQMRVISSVLSLLGLDDVSTIGKSNSLVKSQQQTAPKLSISSTDRLVTPLELIQEKQPSTIPQKLALFAYYREKYEGLPRFARNDLKAYFAKAKQQPPQNFNRDFDNAIKLGYIYEDGSESYLTSKGLESAVTGFSGKALPRGKSVAKNAKTKSRRKSK